MIRSEFEILYGGARGGGKTDAGMAWMLYDIDHPRFRGLVIRKNSKDLNDWIARAKEMYKPARADFVREEIRFPSGSAIVMGHLKDDDAYEKYQGHEYQKILIEELTQIPSERRYLQLISSCRSTIQELRPQVFATTNPGNAGHEWVKKRFGLQGDTSKPIRTVDEKTGRARVFIPARVDDNPHLMTNDPDYVKFLEGLPDGLKEQWRYGMWDDIEIEGAYYAKMVTQLLKEGRYCELNYDPAMPVHTVWDLGLDDSMVVGFWQKTATQIRLIDYYENNGLGLPHYIKIVKDKGFIYGKHFAPHDIEQREVTTGVSRRQTAHQLGIDFVTLPSGSVEDGINALRLMFSRLYINSKIKSDATSQNEFIDCSRFLAAVKSYHKEWDEEKLTFRNNPVHDWSSHGADMGRYAAIAEPMMVANTTTPLIRPQLTGYR